VSIGLIAMALMVVVPSIKAYVEAEDDLVAIREYDVLLVAARNLATERTAAAALISIAPGSDSVVTLRLREVRRATDKVLAKVTLAKILLLEREGRERLLGDLARARETIDRLAARPLSGHPPGERDGKRDGEADAALDAMTAILDDLRPALATASGAMQARSADLGRAAFVALLAGDLREHALRLARDRLTGLGSGRQPDPEANDRINRRRGGIDQMLRSLEAQAGIADPIFSMRLAEVRRLFPGTGLATANAHPAETSLSPVAQGMAAPADPVALLTLYLPALSPLEDLRRAAIDRMEDKISAARFAAVLRLIAMVAATLGLLAWLLSLMRRLFFSVLRPLLAARETIVGLAEERAVALPPGLPEVSELNDLFAAIARLEAQLADRRDLTERLRFQAQTDPLTGLLNRSRFATLGDERLAARRLFPERGTFGVLYLDLDGFKGINDTLGHFAGDQLLREIASRLKNALDEDSLIARLGGDEFAICTEAAGQAAHAALAGRILALFEQPIDLGGVPVRAGVSIGIALWPDGARETTEAFYALCMQADAALYDAKRAGRGRFSLYHHTEIPQFRHMELPQPVAVDGPRAAAG
jgi:diguanylate cyclase (GGDEF)-like protein